MEKQSYESIIAFVNPKSGGQKGSIVLNKMKKYLPNENVFDLTKGGPKPGLERHKDTKNLKIIACGGDGTVGWVLSVLDEVDFGENLPAVSILPLGTGNDLARTLGWGATYSKDSIEGYLKKLLESKKQMLDRWTIKTELTNRSPLDELVRSAQAILPLNVMNNYFSIGADAKIAIDFHEAREKNPERFSSQVYNKTKYIRYYSKELFKETCKNVFQRIKVLECDGVDYLPKFRKKKFECLLVVNILSFMDGIRPWKNGIPGFSDQSPTDGRLEIVGLKAHDFLSLQLGVHGSNIAQGSRIRIVTDSPLPMQVDGEPTLLLASEITIEHKNQAKMLKSMESSLQAKLLTGPQMAVNTVGDIRSYIGLKS